MFSVWYDKGEALFKEAKYEEANTCFNEAITLRPESYNSWFLKASTLLLLERYNEALACKDEAERINPKRFNEFLDKEKK